MAICKRCQSDNPDQTRFCTFCGGRLPSRVEPLAAERKSRSATPPSGKGAVPPRTDTEAEGRYVQKVVYQHFVHAKELIRDRKFDAAIREFERALEVSPGEPTITEMMKKTLSARKAAQAARAETPPPIAFRPASIPPKLAPPPMAPMAMLRSSAPRKPATEQWFKSLAAGPGLSPSVVLDAASSDHVMEIAVTALILGGLGFFAFLLLV